MVFYATICLETMWPWLATANSVYVLEIHNHPLYQAAVVRNGLYTVCPRSFDPFYIITILGPDIRYFDYLVRDRPDFTGLDFLRISGNLIIILVLARKL